MRQPTGDYIRWTTQMCIHKVDHRQVVGTLRCLIKSPDFLFDISTASPTIDCSRDVSGGLDDVNSNGLIHYPFDERIDDFH